MTMNKINLIHVLKWFIYSKIIEIGPLVSVMSAVWENTDGYAQQYRCALDICFMTVLSYLYGIIIYCTINAPDHRNDVFDVLNDNDRQYLREQMELLGKSASNDTSKIGMLPNASNKISINFEEQCFNILTNNDRLNVLKGITKIQNRESLFKSQPHFYNVQSNDDVKHRGMKLQCNNKNILSLNV